MCADRMYYESTYVPPLGGVFLHSSLDSIVTKIQMANRNKLKMGSPSWVIEVIRLFTLSYRQVSLEFR